MFSLPGRVQLNRLWLFSESVNCNFPAYMYSTSSRYIRARRTIRFFSLGDSGFFHATRAADTIAAEAALEDQASWVWAPRHLNQFSLSPPPPQKSKKRGEETGSAQFVHRLRPPFYPCYPPPFTCFLSISFPSFGATATSFGHPKNTRKKIKQKFRKFLLNISFYFFSHS